MLKLIRNNLARLISELEQGGHIDRYAASALRDVEADLSREGFNYEARARSEEATGNIPSSTGT